MLFSSTTVYKFTSTDFNLSSCISDVRAEFLTMKECSTAPLHIEGKENHFGIQMILLTSYTTTQHKYTKTL